MRALVQNKWSPLVLAVPIALSLYLTPEWVLFAGIASPDSGLMPQWPATIALGSVFVVGWPG